MPSTRAGFTLAEAAITIVVVGLALSAVLQALQGSKSTAAHTRDQKIARELAITTLAEIEAGLWIDEIEFTRSGDYAERDFPDFYWELVVGDEAFADLAEDDPDAPFDTWENRRRLEEEREADLDDPYADEEEETVTEPFEKVRIKVTYPRYQDLPSELTLERWIPWEQVYGEEEVEEVEGAGSTDAPSGSGGSSTEGGGGG